MCNVSLHTVRNRLIVEWQKGKALMKYPPGRREKGEMGGSGQRDEDRGKTGERNRRHQSCKRNHSRDI